MLCCAALQGNCTAGPPSFALPAGVRLPPLAAGQCVVLSNRPVVAVADADQQLWLHNVILRVALTSPDQVTLTSFHP